MRATLLTVVCGGIPVALSTHSLTRRVPLGGWMIVLTDDADHVLAPHFGQTARMVSRSASISALLPEVSAFSG